MGERSLTEVPRAPKRILCVTVAAPVGVGIAPNHGPSRKLRQEGWS